METIPSTSAAIPAASKQKSGPLAKALGAVTLAVAGSVGACCSSPCDYDQYICCDTGEQNDGGKDNSSCSDEEKQEIASGISMVSYEYDGGNRIMKGIFNVRKIPCKGQYRMKMKVVLMSTDGNSTNDEQILPGSQPLNGNGGQVEVRSSGIRQGFEPYGVGGVVVDSEGNIIAETPIVYMH